jgi:hypothetical protein
MIRDAHDAQRMRTMTISASLAADFPTWLDAALSRRVPPDVRAFNFNLYEGVAHTWDIELVGSTFFDPANSDWACDTVFSYPKLFFMPHEAAGAQWEQGLAAAIELVAAYLRGGQCRHVLRESLAVAVGFVDRDLTVLWPETAA